MQYQLHNYTCMAGAAEAAASALCSTPSTHAAEGATQRSVGMLLTGILDWSSRSTARAVCQTGRCCRGACGSDGPRKHALPVILTSPQAGA
jgi:hypothetical protein